MKLNWGKNRIDYTTSTGAPAQGADWTQITKVREGTTVLTPNEGTDLEARIEGGEVIDSLPGKTTYQLDFEVFVEKGETMPFSDADGVVSGNYALRVIPVEDETCPAIQIDYCSIKAMHTYNTTDGWRIQYRVKGLKPTSGNTVKQYNATVAEPSTFTLKVDDTSVATHSTSSQPTLSAGDVELTVSGTNMDKSVSAQLLVGDNIINLTKASGATSSSAVFEGATSDGALVSVIVDGKAIKTFA